MPDGSITFSTALDNKELEKDLNQTNRKIAKMGEKLSEQTSARNPLAEKARELGAALDAANAKLEMLKDNAAPADAIAAQAETTRSLTAQFNAADSAVERMDANIAKTTTSLDYQKQKAGEIQLAMSKSSGHIDVMGGAIDRANTAMEKFANRIKGLMYRAFMFSIITKAFRSFRDWMGSVIMSNEQARQSIARLQGALLTLVQPLVNVVIPAFISFTNVLSRVVAAIASVVSRVFGTTTEKSAESAKALNAEQKSLKGTGKAAEKAGKQLAAFDELNQLSDNSSSSGSGTTATDITPDFTGLNEFDTKEMKDKIDEITSYVSGALLALGAILAFSGANIPLGIGLMAIGAIALAAVIVENWEAMSDELRGALTNVVLMLGGFLLALGAVIAFSGANIPLGIGIMIAGAAAMVGAVALNWDDLSKSVSSAVGAVLIVLGTALLVFGAILAFSGANLPLGFGLIIAGAAALGVGAIALNWDSVSKALQGPIGVVTAAVSVALLAIGAMLAFSGVKLLLGISLIAAGAIGLVATIAANWNTIKEKLQGPLGETFALISGFLLVLGLIILSSGANIILGIALIAAGAIGLATVIALNWDTIKESLQGPMGETAAWISGFLIVLGIILVASGVGLPLGIALIAAGAVGLVTVAALNWNAILDKLKEVWGGIKDWWTTSIAPKFTLKFWQDMFNNIKEGLVSKIKDAVNGGIALFNQFIDWINDKLKFSWDGLSIAGKEIFPGGTVQLLTIPKIPMLAQGAVIPPNREFMAVLGDQGNGRNLEAPEALIRQIVREESGKSGGSNTRPMTIIFEVGKREFGRLVYEANEDETQRVGLTLA